MGLLDGLTSSAGTVYPSLVESMSRRDAERWRVVEQSGLHRSGGRSAALTCWGMDWIDTSSGFVGVRIGGGDIFLVSGIVVGRLGIVGERA